MSNFNEMLSKLQAADEGLEGLTKEDFEKIVGDIRDKIDGIKYYISKCDAEAGRLGKYIEELQAKKKSVENSAKNLKDWATSCMVNNNMPYLEGENFTLKLQSRKALKIDESIELDAKSFIKYKGLVKRKYSWDSKAAKASVEKGKHTNIGKIIENQHSVFRVKKGMK